VFRDSSRMAVKHAKHVRQIVSWCASHGNYWLSGK
jgi:hypothetical protein